jgi:hypothetical protein
MGSNSISYIVFLTIYAELICKKYRDFLKKYDAELPLKLMIYIYIYQKQNKDQFKR